LEHNDSYFKKFGFTFLVCATGKSALEMLAMLKEREQNDLETELRVAAGFFFFFFFLECFFARYDEQTWCPLSQDRVRCYSNHPQDYIL
jgi:hypothetical protein